MKAIGIPRGTKIYLSILTGILLCLPFVFGGLEILGTQTDGVINIQTPNVSTAANASFNASACGGNFACLNNTQTFTGINTFTSRTNFTNNVSFGQNVTIERQILGANGLTSRPTYSFFGDTDSGWMRAIDGSILLVFGGSPAFSCGNLILGTGFSCTFDLPLLLQNGNASVPSVTFVNDADTGWYNPIPGGNILGFTANGSAVGSFSDDNWSFFKKIDAVNISAQNITADQYFGNGTNILGLNCSNIVGADTDFCADASGGGNPFNQVLNTTSNVSFNLVNTTFINITKELHLLSQATIGALLFPSGVSGNITSKASGICFDAINNRLSIGTNAFGVCSPQSTLHLGYDVNGDGFAQYDRLNEERYLGFRFYTVTTGQDLFFGQRCLTCSGLGDDVVLRKAAVPDEFPVSLAAANSGVTKFSTNVSIGYPRTGSVPSVPSGSTLDINGTIKLTPIILPLCASSVNGTLARNNSDSKLYFCDGMVWNALY